MLQAVTVTAFLTAFRLRFIRQKPPNLDQRRDKKQPADRAENETGRKPRKRRVFPDLEKSERPVDAHRHERQKKPDARQRFDLLDRAHERIDDKTEQQTEINAETARADGEAVIFQMKRAFGDLVAEKAEEFINRIGDPRPAVHFRQRREQDQKNPQENERKTETPGLESLFFQVLKGDLRRVVFDGFGHFFSGKWKVESGK